MNYLIFGANGTIYFQQDPDSPIVSAETAFKFFKKTNPNTDLGADFSFWANYLDIPVIFQSGLTLKKFFNSLAVWENYFSLQTQVNLKEYINEMSLEVDKKSKSYMCLDYLMLYRNISFNPIRSENFKSDNVDYDSHLYEVSTSHTLNGFVIGKDEPYDFSYINMQYIADCPIFIQDFTTIQFGDYLKNKNSTDHRTIEINNNTFGVQKTNNKNLFLETEFETITLEVLLRSFFRYIFKDIKKREGVGVSNNYDESAKIFNFPLNENKINTLSSPEEIESNIFVIPFKKISNEKDNKMLLDSFLNDFVFKKDDFYEELVQAEKTVNPNINSEEIEIATPPENRKSCIGIP